MTEYKEKFEKMRIAGKLASKTLDMLTDYIKPGISTNKIDRLAYDFIKDNVEFFSEFRKNFSNISFILTEF